MSALVTDPAWRADPARLLPDVPGAGARVPVELVEPVRRGSARPLDPDRLTAPVREHLRSLGALRPAGPPVPDVPLNVGVRVLGAEPAGLGECFPPPVGDADVVPVVRTNGTPGGLAAVREPKPDLPLDVAYHHAAFAVPGASACLAVRARHGRGDPEPPDRPAARTTDLPLRWVRHREATA
ncbi:hypothetical protein AB0425_04235 [Actinosynnema sp. NPDC051121]